MNKLLILIVAVLPFLPQTLGGAQTAQARLFCLSLRCQSASAVDSTGFRWTLDMTTLVAGINGELSPDFFNSGYSNSTYVDLYSEILDETFPGALAVDIPETGDNNGNGCWDFFEVSQAVNGLPSPGAYDISGIGNGEASATWYRDAGSSAGTCVLSIPDPFNSARQLVFIHAFDLIEYLGPLSYTAGASPVSGSVSLTETSAGNTLEGPVEFLRSPTNRFNQLSLQNAFLTNAAQQTLTLYAPTWQYRNPLLGTNYHGPVEFNDGDPNTEAEDYYSWELYLDDLNDADHDGIPDFSDDPATVPPPRRPWLTLATSTTNVWFTISGAVGSTNLIQTATNLASPSWQPVVTVKLTNDPQTVSVALPTAGAAFWRVLVK